MNYWHDKHVIITGASSGIGWALAEHLATGNAHATRLGLIARRRNKLDELAAKLDAHGTRVAVRPRRCRRPRRDAMTAVSHLENELGPCDAMIANAGMHEYSPGRDFSAAAANRVIATNVQGVFNSFGPVLPHMLERRSGHLVAVASIAGMLGLPDVGAYSASKAAVITFMESLRVDLHRTGVKATTICPGFVYTPMIEDHHPEALKFALPAPEAARRITRAIERGKREYWFPWQTWLSARIGRALPLWAYEWVARRLPRTRRPPDDSPLA